METSNFSYTALTKDSIRLLDISISASDEILCNIRTVSLNESPNYYALSYAWGSTNTLHPVICNGQQGMKIADNLYEAIRTLFKPPINIDFPIWIDGISINQEDDEEKSEQVGRMGDVFWGAKKVLVWLGPTENQSDLAMDWLEGLSKILPRIARAPQIYEFEEYGLPDMYHQDWLALGHLYRRKWFGRLWTFQEAVLATKLLIVCGEKSVEGELLFMVAKELNRLFLFRLTYAGYSVPDHEDGITAITIVWNVSRQMEAYGAIRIISLLRIADKKVCLYPRDRIYAMLGMTALSFKNRIRVSYTKTSEQDAVEPYIDCTTACIEDGEMGILQLVAGRTRMQGLPSWCLNLQSSQGPIRTFPTYVRAGISWNGHNNRHGQSAITIHSNKLNAIGFQMDTVSEVIDGVCSWESGQEIGGRAMRFLHWEGQCRELACKTKGRPLETTPVEHIFTISCTTRSNSWELKDRLMQKLYGDFIEGMARQAIGRYDLDPRPPVETRPFYYEGFQAVVCNSRGRRYFSTENGRLGVGPPEIKQGDRVCIFYGMGPVFILRPVKSEFKEWYFVGDAFVHELMELDEIRQDGRGTDEVFTII